MIILLEGPDGSGKSTLAQRIAVGCRNAHIEHFGVPKTDEEAYNYYKVYMAAIQRHEPGEIVVLDRSWYSDMVYGPVMRGRDEMTQEHADMLAAACVAHGGGLVIYCTAPVKVLWARCKKRGESYIASEDKLWAIDNQYKIVMSTAVKYLPVVRYDTAARWL